MTKYTKLLNNVPQTEKPFNKKNMVKNDAGGYVFQISDDERLMRFLILGSDSDTYYSKARKITDECIETIKNIIAADTKKAVDTIVTVSTEGRAPRNDHAIFALAMCAAYSNLEGRNYALSNLPKICRTATHLFQFVDTIKTMRGWGANLRRHIAKWYTDKELNDLVYQVIKYRNRSGWTHKDVIRLSHPRTNDNMKNAIFADIVEQTDINVSYINYVDSISDADKFQLERYTIGMNMSKDIYTEDEICNYIVKYNIPMECLPTTKKQSKKIWETLLLTNNLPLTATIRNLGHMSKIGVLSDFSDAEKKIVDNLTNEEYLKKSRIHPLNILIAKGVYQGGESKHHANLWTPNNNISQALEDAFYLSFKNVEPTNKNTMVALDVSGSMSCPINNGSGLLTSSTVSAAFAMIYLRTEKYAHIYGFSDEFIHLDIEKTWDLKKVMKYIQHRTFGATDCALPMIYAKNKKLKIDTFVIFTDNETWYGKKHPYMALEEYQSKINPDAKLVVCATSNNAYSIAERTDYRKETNSALNIIGFDSAWPQLIRDFTC